MKKKILSFLLAFSMLAVLIPSAYAWELDASGNPTGMCEDYWDNSAQAELPSKAKWTYNPSTKTVTISGTGIARITDTCDIFELVPMGDSSDPWNEGKTDLVYNVVVEEGITGIQIVNLYDVNSVVLPNSLTEIGWYSFANSNISTVIIPDNVTAIKDNAFSECKSLKTVTIPASVKTITADSFASSAVKDVIYKGTKAQWAAFPLSNIYQFPSELANANVHCTDGAADPAPAPPNGMYTISGNSTIFHVPVDVSAMPSSFKSFRLRVLITDSNGVLKSGSHIYYNINELTGATADITLSGQLQVGDRVHVLICPHPFSV